ncbi:UNVERIFIED_CONTAM: hypothetical protein HDU68_000353 [Siphonaria sp. JEL0065]|nr:hypothetical protein HDU68_000353 [Siphonaria sp. JEL0065]
MVASQTADYYEVALRHSKEGLHILTRQRFPKSWIQQLTAKSFIFAAIAHFHSPLQLGADQALGERVARLTIAKDLAARAYKSSKDVGGSTHHVVKGYLDVISSSLTLADGANFDKHNHSAVDASLVTLLKRPKNALSNPVALTESMGDLSRFHDMFSGYKPLEEELDLRVLGTFAVEVIERASRSLIQMKKEVEEETKVHTLMETQSLKEILAENKTRAQAVAEHIQVIQGDEAIESFEDLKKKLELIHIAINQHLHEARKILETTPAQSLPDGQTKALHSTLCKAVHQTQQLQTARQKELQNFRTQFSSHVLADFHPKEWSFENLNTILPALDPSRDLEIDDVVSEKKRENAVADLKCSLMTLEKLKSDCKCKLEETKNFVESMGTIRDNKAIHAQRLRLKLIEEAVSSIHLEKQIAIKKIFDVAGTIKQVSPKRQVEEQSRKTIESFEASIKAYKKFRSGITLEISESSKLKDEATIIYNKAKDIKKSSGDNAAKTDKEIQYILTAQANRLTELTDREILNLVQPATNAFNGNKPPTIPPPTTGGAGNQTEQELLKNINNYLSGAKNLPNKQKDDHEAILTHILQFQMDRAKASLAATTSTASQPANDIHQLIQRILDPSSIPVATEKPKEDPPDVKTTNELSKFEDMLHSLAASTQQEITRLQRIKVEKEKAVADAAFEEGKRREELEKLARKAHKVLGGVCSIGMDGGLGYQPGLSNGVIYDATTQRYVNAPNVSNNPATGRGQQPRYPNVQRARPAPPSVPERIMTYHQGEVKYDVFHDAIQDQSAYRNTTFNPREVMSPAEEEEIEIQDRLDKELSERELAANKARRHLEKMQEEAMKKIEEAKKYALDLQVEQTNIMFHMPENLFGNQGHSEPSPSPSVQRPKAQRLQKIHQPTNVNIVQLPQTPVSDSFYEPEQFCKADTTTKSIPSSFFANISAWNNAAPQTVTCHSDDSRSDSSHSKVSRSRKQVNLAKPGMVDRYVQDMEEKESSNVIHKKPHRHKSAIKHDSGLGSFSEQSPLQKTTEKLRKHGDIAKMVKFENESAVSHFLGGASPAGER